MAIQPVDLQLAYLAAPASAAAANTVQQAPAAAQQASQAAFVSQLEQREETIEETPRAEGAKIGEREGGGNAGTYNPQKRKRQALVDVVMDEVQQASPGEETHFIDTTA